MGVKFVKREDLEKSYLVKCLSDGDSWFKVMSANEIFDMMDMSDCYDIEIHIFRIGDFYEPIEPCTFHGAWSDLDDPLKMWITDCEGEILSVGYGTDH